MKECNFVEFHVLCVVGPHYALPVMVPLHWQATEVGTGCLWGWTCIGHIVTCLRYYYNTSFLLRPTTSPAILKFNWTHCGPACYSQTSKPRRRICKRSLSGCKIYFKPFNLDWGRRGNKFLQHTIQWIWSCLLEYFFPEGEFTWMSSTSCTLISWVGRFDKKTTTLRLISFNIFGRKITKSNCFCKQHCHRE